METGAGEVVKLVLPKSGRRIMARKPLPSQILAWGNILNRLKAVPEVPGQPFTATQLDDTAAIIFDLLSFCYVEPRLSLVPQGNHEIGPKDVPIEDNFFILRWALGVENGHALAGLPSDRIRGRCRRGRRRL